MTRSTKNVNVQYYVLYVVHVGSTDRLNMHIVQLNTFKLLAKYSMFAIVNGQNLKCSSDVGVEYSHSQLGSRTVLCLNNIIPIVA